MLRRDFLRWMFFSASWMMADSFLQPLKLFAADKHKGEYYHILLLSDLHLPWKPNKFPTKEEQEIVWSSKQTMLSNINSIRNEHEGSDLRGLD